MRQNIWWKIGLIVAVLGAAVYMSWPLSEKIALGLDLQGGMHLVLEVESAKAVENELVRIKDGMRKMLVRNKLRFRRAEIEDTQIVLEFRDPETREEAFELMRDEYGFYTLTTTGDAEHPMITLQLPEKRLSDLKEETFRQAFDTITNRVDEFGVKEPIIQRQGIAGNRILVQLPGADDAARAKKNIGRTAFLEFRIVKDGPDTRENLVKRNSPLTEAVEILPSRRTSEGQKMYYLLEREALVTGADLEYARVGRDQYNLPAVDFTMTRSGARKFADLTGSNINQFLAIVLDRKVMSAPRIQARISRNGQITGQFGLEEAQDLSINLRSGALPAPVNYLEERSVGPSLGKDSIQMGIRSCIVGGIFVVLFMLIYYKIAGIIANLAMAFTLIILVGGLGSLNATLTLPGIAGIILTIGMAVDANVLVFERIREELRLGKTIRTAVSAGFSKAFRTILDANVTTLIAAFVLLNFGSGPVRGFAITLTLGVMASMFCAVFVARVIFDLILSNPNVRSISM